MKPVILHREAMATSGSAMAYYEGRRTGLGSDLVSEVESAIARIPQNPGLFPLHKNTNFRKCLVQRFPYTIFFPELDEVIWVAAVAHAKRRPNYRTHRTPD